MSLDTSPSSRSRSVASVLSLAQAHLNGLHIEPRPDCWRCHSHSEGNERAVAEARAAIENRAARDRGIADSDDAR